MSDFRFAFVTDRMALGPAPTSGADIEALVAAGITAVLNCCEDNDAPFIGGRVMYLQNATDDPGCDADQKPKKPASWFATSLNFVMPLLVVPRNRVYVHCHMGRNRGASTAYAVLRALGLNAELSMRLVKDACTRFGRPDAPVCYAPDADRAVTELGYV